MCELLGPLWTTKADEHATKGKTVFRGTTCGGVIQQRREQTKLYSLIKIITHTSARLRGQRASTHSSESVLFHTVVAWLKNNNKIDGEEKGRLDSKFVC